MADAASDPLYHGGPAGLTEILPMSQTCPPGSVAGPRAWICLTTDLRIARYFAAGRAYLAGQRHGAVYLAEPDGELQPDIDAPWSWRAPSARIVRTAALVSASQAPQIQRWFTRWAPGAFAASDRALGISEWRTAALRGAAPAMPDHWDRSAAPRWPGGPAGNGQDATPAINAEPGKGARRALVALALARARQHPAGGDGRKAALSLRDCLIKTRTLAGARRALGEIEQPGLRSAALALLEELAADISQNETCGTAAPTPRR